MGNAVFNPLSVLTRATLGAMCRNPGTRALARAGMQECLAIASALGARPEIEIERRIDGAERVGEHRTSTLQDLDAGKRLELDALIVAVVELADLTGTPAPTLRALSASSALLAESLGASVAERPRRFRSVDTRGRRGTRAGQTPGPTGRTLIPHAVPRRCPPRRRYDRLARCDLGHPGLASERG